MSTGHQVGRLVVIIDGSIPARIEVVAGDTRRYRVAPDLLEKMAKVIY